MTKNQEDQDRGSNGGRRGKKLSELAAWFLGHRIWAGVGGLVAVLALVVTLMELDRDQTNNSAETEPDVNTVDFPPAHIHIVDVGPSLCVVAAVPDGTGDAYLVYDAGNWANRVCLENVRQIVDGDRIDLFVVSHGDADHIGDAAEILREFAVGRVIRQGAERQTRTWMEFVMMHSSRLPERARVLPIFRMRRLFRVQRSNSAMQL